MHHRWKLKTISLYLKNKKQITKKKHLNVNKYNLMSCSTHWISIAIIVTADPLVLLAASDNQSIASSIHMVVQ